MEAGTTHLLAPSEAEERSLHLGLAGGPSVLEGPWVTLQDAMGQ